MNAAAIALEAAQALRQRGLNTYAAAVEAQHKALAEIAATADPTKGPRRTLTARLSAIRSTAHAAGA